jgi:hypothetical protein
MSLHKFAEQVASQGRGDDSLLVHMTPDEVRNLQQFAQANGTTLTINPTTGLPEAGLLSDLFKTIAPIALGAFLGPAGMGMSSMMAGVATGGITALATGSLSRGLMAGLGAYGGAGIGDSLMKTGTGALSQSVGAGLSEEAAQQAVASKLAAATPMETLTAGFNSATANPAAMGTFAKSNLANIGMAAAPIMAMQPTTKMPEPKDTGYIRQFDYNINPDTGKPDPLYGMRAMTPVKASEFGNKTFQGQRDLFRQQNPNPYELGVGSLNQPPQQQQATPMATGGIVALADGGVPRYNGVGDSLIFDYFKNLDQSKLASGALDAQIAADMQKYKVSAADIARVTGTQNQLPDLETRFVKAVATPTTDASEFLAATKSVGLQDQNLANALSGSGLSASAQYALTHTLDDTAGIATAPKAAQDFYNSYGYKAGDAPGDKGGLEGLYTNIDYAADKLQDQINAGKLTVAQAQNLSLAEMERLGINQADVKAATGSDFANLFKAKAATVTCGVGFKLSPDGKSCVPETIVGTVTCGPGTKLSPDGKSCVLDVVTPTPFTSVVPGGTKIDNAVTYDNGAYGNYGNNTGNPLTSTPGDIITNPDGTRTVVPNIPGRPYGGFSGMDDVKDAYTAGGGSLGYTSPVVKTAAEHNALYNKLTDDSLDAYNYLMGKGKNLTQRKAETRNRPVMQRYDEAVLGRKIGKPAVKTTETKAVVGVPGNPQSYFNEAEYLAANPDVANELKTGKSVSGQPTKFTSGYEHYLMYGKAGGRAFTGDYEGYLTAAALADAANAGGGGGPGNATSATTAANAVSDSNTANSITGLAAPADTSISDTSISADSVNGVDAVGGYYSRGKLNYRDKNMAMGGVTGYAIGGGLGSLGSYSDGGRLLRGPGDGVSDSIPATIGAKRQPARLADGEFVIPARIVSELGNGSTDAGAKKLYAMMDRVQRARGKTTGKNKVAANSRADKYLPA